MSKQGKKDRYATANEMPSSEVNESVYSYATTRASSPSILSLTDKPERSMTALEKLQLSRSGISKKALENLKLKSGLDYESLARGLSVTKATLFSKKGTEKFGADLSERIISLADLYSFGYAVFGDTGAFNQWMHHPNMALGGEAPYALVDNQFGREEVRNLIGRIEHGVYS